MKTFALAVGLIFGSLLIAQAGPQIYVSVNTGFCAPRPVYQVIPRPIYYYCAPVVVPYYGTYCGPAVLNRGVVVTSRVARVEVPIQRRIVTTPVTVRESSSFRWPR